MNRMINSKMDHKNIALAKNLYWLRQELDVHCLISVNTHSIEKRGVGKSFFVFLRKSSIDLITLNICRIYEYEKRHELNSIEGVLKYIIREQPSGLDMSRIKDFIGKYDHNTDEGQPLSALSSTVARFKAKYQKELERFKTYRNKSVAHTEFGFNPDDLPSYDVMERLFNFASEFYMLVSAAFISVSPCDLNSNSNRKVRVGLERILRQLGLQDIKREMK